VLFTHAFDIAETNSVLARAGGGVGVRKSKRHAGTTAGGVRESGDSASVTEEPCDVSKNETFLNGDKDCDAVTGQYALFTDGGMNPDEESF
jgi:hypothetical protein